MLNKLVAKELLEIKAVFLQPNNPFTWSSGIKSPIYCDNRLTLSFPKTRNIIEEGLAQIIRENYSDVEVIMGTSTAGIAHAALVANILNLPMGYVRGGSAKKHGRQNQIEGKVEAGQKVVIIEDLISTGGSAIEVCEVLREVGANVLGIASIFTYGLEKGKVALEAANLKNISLSNYEALVQVALEENYIESSDVTKLEKFIKNPSDSSWME